jgi:outer membrane protein assembly factor BamB
MNKNPKTLIFALTLTLLMAISLFSLPEVTAHDPPWTKNTWMYVAVSPSPVGVGQQVLITWWTDLLPQTAVGAYGDRWQGVTITVTDPNGNNQTLGPFTSDPVGGGYVTFTPDEAGVYQIQSHFPGHTYTGEPAPPPPQVPRGSAYIGDILLPSDSEVVDLEVQETPLSFLPDTPLPTEYWSRPINAENRQWYQIASDWLGGSAYITNPTMPSTSINYYGTGPETSHIIWTKPFVFGGVVDGEFGTNSYYDGLSYERLWVNPIIIDGNLYVNQMQPPRYGWYCLDLQTGEEKWFQNSTGPLLPNIGPSGGSHTPSGAYPYLSFGQIYAYDSPNQHGALAYLWSTYTDPDNGTNIWQMYDAWTGNWICNLNGVPSSGVAFAPSTQITGADGSELILNYNSNAGWLTLWNSSRVIQWKPVYISNEFWEWRPALGQSYNATTGYEWNVTAPKGLGSINYVFEDFVLGTYGQSSFAYGSGAYGYWSMSIEPGREGTLNWRKDYSAPPIKNATMYLGPASVEDGIFTEWVKETRTWTGYDINTGNKVWGPTESEDQYNMYGRGTNNAVIYNGSLLTYGYDGILRSYDVKTGEKLWETPTESGGIDSYFDHGRYPLSLGCIVDDKIYLFSSEHSPSKPLWKGSKLRCVDINTGESLWAADHWGNVPVTADGVIVDLNNYDGQITAYSKGPTETTITASPKVSTYGDSVLIEGTITDISAGTTQNEQAIRFPQGVPAMSDASMTEWMAYVYHQQPMPTNLTGVEVTLETVDPNGNFYQIGTTTSDADGMFKYLFTPEVPGEYTLIASFDGSKAYYSSYSQTAIGVTDAPAPTPEPTVAAPSMADLYLIPGIVIIVVAIAVVGALILISLRKRP